MSLKIQDTINFNTRKILERYVFEGVVYGYDVVINDEKAKQDPAEFVSIITAAVMAHLDLVLDLPPFEVKNQEESK